MQGSLTGVLASRNKSRTFTGTSVLVPLQYYGDATTFYRDFVNATPLTYTGESTTLYSATVNAVPFTAIGESTTLYSAQVNNVPLSS